MTESWMEKMAREERERLSAEASLTQGVNTRINAELAERNAKMKAKLEKLAEELGIKEIREGVLEVWKIGKKYTRHYPDTKDVYTMREAAYDLELGLEDKFERYHIKSGQPGGYEEVGIDGRFFVGDQGNGGYTDWKVKRKVWRDETPSHVIVDGEVISTFSISLCEVYRTGRQRVTVSDSKGDGGPNYDLHRSESIELEGVTLHDAHTKIASAAFTLTKERIQSGRLPQKYRSRH